MSLEGHRIDVSLLTFVEDLMNILIESTPGAMNLRDRAHDKNLTHELGKVGCELESSNDQVDGVKRQKTSCQMSVEKVARTRSLPSDGSALWMLTRNVRRGRHNGQAKDHGYAHQFLQTCRSMEVQTRFFSDQEDSFPISDQWSGAVRMRTDVFFVHYRQCSSWSPTLRGSWWKFHQFEPETSKSQGPGT